MINLDQLRQLLGDEKLLLKYVALFKSSGPKHLQNIRITFDNKDLDAFKIATHSLKTQFAYLGVKEAYEITLMLENIEKEQILNADPKILQSINLLAIKLKETVKELETII
ncbi:MAG: Hpt domain-containing protein [Saprospiraceae bacterium]|nr:Hpt domain-containing protein [Saprospiraceae bacterium]